MLRQAFREGSDNQASDHQAIPSQAWDTRCSSGKSCRSESPLIRSHTLAFIRLVNPWLILASTGVTFSDFVGSQEAPLKLSESQGGAQNCVNGDIFMIKGFESLRITNEDLLIGREKNLAYTD